MMRLSPRSAAAWIFGYTAPVSADCLDTDAVVELVEGLLRPDRRVAVEEHLSTCSDCRLLVAEVARDDAHETMRRALVPGDKVGRFPITGLLGRGSMGVVYEAYDPELHRAVALKLVGLNAQAEDAPLMRARLMREARALASVSHANVVGVFEVGEHRGEIYIAMELIEGLTVRTWLEVEPRSSAQILALLSSAAQGLAAAHRSGLVHRDVKPDNILVTREGIAKVVDFGLVRPTGTKDLPAHPSAERSRLTATDVAVGTPAFMAPEQHLGQPVDPRTDQFSFCVVLFNALYGTHPFDGDTSQALLSCIAQGPREAPSGHTSNRVQRAIVRGLSKAPEDRFDSMQDLLRELAPPTRRRAWPWAVALALVLLALAVTSQLRPAPCEAGVRLADQIWTAGQTASAEPGAAGESSQADALSRLDGFLAQYQARWAASHRVVCRASRVHGHQSDEALDRRMLCLDRLRKRAEVVGASGIAARTTPKAQAAMQAALRLPDPGACEVIVGANLPTASGKRKRYRDVQLELATARAELDLRQLDEGAARAVSALAQARVLDDDGLRARARLTMARSDIERGAIESAQKHLSAGMLLAASAKDDDLLARLSISKVESLTLQARFAAAIEATPTAEALVVRGGDAPLLRSRLLRFLSIAQSWEFENAAATASIRRAIALAESAQQAGRPQLVANLAVLANHLVETQWGPGALADAEVAHAEALKLYGPDHRRTNEARFFLGAAQAAHGEVNAGLGQMRDALDREQQSRGEHPTHAYAFALLGDVLARTGDCTRALEAYQRASKIAEQAFGPRDYMVAMVLRSVAACDPHDAPALLMRSLSIRRATRGPDHAASLRAELDLVHSDLAQSVHRSAARRLRRIEAAVRTGPDKESRVRWHSLAAWTAYQRGDCLEAEKLRAQAHDKRGDMVMSWPAPVFAGSARWSCEPAAHP